MSGLPGRSAINAPASWLPPLRNRNRNADEYGGIEHGGYQ